jgi:hypothetical protein
MKARDVFENMLEISIGHKDNLQVLRPIAGDDFIKNFCQQLTALLNGIQPGRPEEQWGLIILNQSKSLLKDALVDFFTIRMVFGSILIFEMLVVGRIKGRIRRI